MAMPFIDIEQLRANVTDYSSIDYVPSTGSTNADLLAGGTPGAVLIAGAQTAGRGRLGRAWASPEGTSVALSVLIDEPPVDRLGLLPLAMGLAAADAIEGTQLKWPNDLLVGEKKIAGILAQAEFGGEFKSGKSEGFKSDGFKSSEFKSGAAENPAGSLRVVIGIGINVNLTADQLPVPHATSLKLEGMDTDATVVVERLLVAFARREAQWKAGDPQLINDYRKACATIGQNVRLEAPGGDVTGRVDDVTDSGEIVVGGTAYSAGDVTHLRPHN